MQEKLKVESLKLKGFRLTILALCSWLLVPIHAQELLNYPLDTVNGEEVYRYEVERSIGLYRIGVNFNVPQSEIIRLNPQLRERGLHYGETLYLPTGRKVTNEGVKELTNEGVKEGKEIRIDPIITDSIKEDTIVSDSIPVSNQRRVIELALMLPFESQQTKRSGNAERMMEFYQGALLALRNMQNDSTLYRLRVYDTERSERRVQALCDSTELDSVRGILGLVYPIQIERMASWSEAHRVPLLVPFSDDIDLATHTQVLQFNSTDLQEADSLCQWMIAQDSAAHFIAVEVREADLAPWVRLLRKQMRVNKIDYTGMALRDLMTDSCTYALNATKENIILLHSDRFQNVRMVLPHLIKLQEEGYKIRIISQYSWQKESIDLPQVYVSMFKSAADSKSYDALWSETYTGGHVSETPRYDLLGYDLMQALVKWVEKTSEERMEMRGLQSDIQWRQMNNGGWQNGAARVVER